MEDAKVWRALGSPHRRAMLDALREGAKTTTSLCAVLPELSRFAVMKPTRNDPTAVGTSEVADAIVDAMGARV